MSEGVKPTTSLVFQGIIITGEIRVQGPWPLKNLVATGAPKPSAPQPAPHVPQPPKAKKNVEIPSDPSALDADLAAAAELPENSCVKRISAPVRHLPTKLE